MQIKIEDVNGNVIAEINADGKNLSGKITEYGDYNGYDFVIPAKGLDETASFTCQT